jgi:hypothetical protein
MENREYIPCPRSHVFVGFHSFYDFLKNNLVYTMLNHLRKKKVRVYTMSDSLLRETNRVYTMPLSWQTLGSHNVIKVLAYRFIV